MSNADLDRAFELIAALSDRLNVITQRLDAFAQRIEEDRIINRQLIESNSRAIAALAERTAELQAGQALLTQLIAEEQNSRQEFRRTTNATLERLERNQAEMQQEIIAIRRDMSNR